MKSKYISFAYNINCDVVVDVHVSIPVFSMHPPLNHILAIDLIRGNRMKPTFIAEACPRLSTIYQQILYIFLNHDGLGRQGFTFERYFSELFFI